MPRRNNRYKPYAGWKKRRVQHDEPMTCQQMARSLVERGLCSPLILGPLNPRERIDREAA